MKDEYTSYRAMVSRCMDKNDSCYDYYGGRGISICDAWVGNGGFQRWLDHIGPKPDRSYTQDRIDVNKGYVPGNVRWASRKTQANNTRTRKSLRLIAFNGEVNSLVEWSRKTGIKPTSIAERIRRGWTVEEALSKELVKSSKLPEKTCASCGKMFCPGNDRSKTAKSRVACNVTCRNRLIAKSKLRQET